MIQKIIKTIEQFENIIILRHVIPDGDAYGSQVGLKLLIEKNYPEKKVYIQGTELDYLKWISRMDENVEDKLFEKSLVIVTDCGNVERIDDQRYINAEYLIKIDHHPDVTPYGDLSWVDTTFSSASEMIGLLAINAGWEITPEAAKVIYHGILTDSGRFSFEGTTSRTFEVAAKLFETKFDFAKLGMNMYKRTFHDLQIQSKVINLAKTKENVGYIIIDKNFVEENNLKYEAIGKYANVLKGIDNIDIWLTFSIREDGQWRVEFRSSSIQINDLAVKWGGGGHRLAAGAIVKNLQEVEQIIDESIELLK